MVQLLMREPLRSLLAKERRRGHDEKEIRGDLERTCFFAAETHSFFTAVTAFMLVGGDSPVAECKQNALTVASRRVETAWLSWA